jgi:hypothetical protein
VGNIIEGQRVGKGQHITVSTASGNPSIDGTKKGRRVEPRRTPTPTLTLSESSEEDDDDEEDQYEAEDEEEDQYEAEDEEEEEEEDREQSNIPSGRPDGLDSTSDTDRLDTFLNSFSAMRGADKQIFTCSGRVLENLIHAGVIANPAAAEDALDWVIDLKVENVRGWFSPPELEELRSWLPPTPKVDQFFTYARHRYDKVRTYL